jgi:hypothetical protein
VKALVILLMCARVAAADGRQISYAIVIGNNAPPTSGTSETLQPLRYADDDAVRYHQLFSHLGESHLLTVLDTQTQKRYPGLASSTQPPTMENLRRVVDDLIMKMQRDRQHGDHPVLYFAFSGHGAHDEHGEPFLALLDGALTQKSLYEDVLARMPTTFTHVIVDACHAGGVVGVRGDFFAHETDARAVPVTAADVEPILESTPLARYPNIGVILAATVDQETHEWSVTESGVFSHEIISGLLGAADVNGDGVIEYSELSAFVAAANRDIKDPRAVPHVIARPPAANQNVALLALPSLVGVRRLRGAAGTYGHFHIELSNGQRYLDAHLDRGAEITVALPEQTVAYIRTETQEAALPANGDVALAHLAFSDRDLASRGSIAAAYRDALFATGFGRDYYLGYVDSTGAIGVAFSEERDDQPRGSTGHRKLALTSVVVGGLAAATAVTFGVLAANARSDFEHTSLQREAHDAQVRYERDLPIAITSSVVAVVAGAAAWYLWPRSTITVVPTAEHGAMSLSFGARW